ncbi:POK10 protein, partial [Turnix velox]|nr:POK10 protein [Turnix velox]
LGEGNQRADDLVTMAAPLSDFVKARESHSAFHQNAKGLHKRFNITMEEARGVVHTCPVCSHHGAGLGLGVNPQSLEPQKLWQMDVTHVSAFGRLKYVHITIDTSSKFLWATAQ